MSAAAALTRRCVVMALVACAFAGAAFAQVAPSATEIAAYTGLFAAAARGDAAEIGRLAASGADVNAREAYGRTPLHVATYGRHREAIARWEKEKVEVFARH